MGKKLKIINFVESIVIIVLIILIVIINLYNRDENNSKNPEILKEEQNEISDKVIKNENPEISKEQVVEGLKFMDTSIIYLEGKGSVLEVKVINEGENTYHLNGISAIVKDKNGKKIEILTTDNYIQLSPESQCLYNLNSEMDLTKDGYFVEYKLSYQE